MKTAIYDINVQFYIFSLIIKIVGRRQAKDELGWSGGAERKCEGGETSPSSACPEGSGAGGAGGEVGQEEREGKEVREEKGERRGEARRKASEAGESRTAAKQSTR